MTETWTNILAESEIEAGWVTFVESGPRALAVYDTPSGLYVSTARCSHGGANLCDGYFDGHLIECPLHQGAFDVRTGQPVSSPATRPIKTFPARRHGGFVQIKTKG